MAPITGAQQLLFKFFEKVLDIFGNYGILTKSFAGHQLHMGEFPSGQRGQTVNLLLIASVVRIHLPPPAETTIVIRTPRCWTTMVVFVFALQIAAFSSRTFLIQLDTRFSNSGKPMQKLRIMCDSNTLV